jgi:lysyl-tRNA synthetase class 2
MSEKKQKSQPEKISLREQRIQKLANVENWNFELYPELYVPENKITDLKKTFDPEGNDNEEKESYKIAGRIKAKNLMGKAGFLRIEDSTGIIQLYASRDALEKIHPNLYSLFKSLDIGDLIGVEGSLFLTKTKEITLRIKNLCLLAKCIQPLPIVKEKENIVYDSFEDIELRYRRRYVDLIVNRHVREDFIKRSRIIREIRNFLEEEGFLEVETPMLVSKKSGAAAKPFTTHHNALNIPLFLRVAPELYLKRLIIGGIDKVFELNRNFRNEGLSRKHNPEFTMLEIYQAYANLDTMLHLTEKLISSVSLKVNGSMKIKYQNDEIDLTPPWKRKRYVEIIKEYTDIDFDQDLSLDDFKKSSEKYLTPEELSAIPTKWKLADAVFDAAVEPNLIQPIFITDYPKELSPLAKSNPDNPKYVKRFEPFIIGQEIGNAFSELNDPMDQKERFQKQAQAKASGDEEAMDIDEDFIYALECGMPPTGGLGIGIDRIVMLFLDKTTIKDSILFPLLKPLDETNEENGNNEKSEGESA